MRKMTREELTKSLLLYAVTDRHWLGDRTLYDVVRESLEGGVTFLQLREKNLDEDSFYEEAVRLQAMAREYKVPFVINDNVEIAVRMNADGVHVGQAPGFFDDQVAHLMPHPVIGSILLDQPGCADHGGQGCAHFMGQSIDQLLALAGLYPQGFLPLLYGFVHGDEPVGEPGDLVPFRGRFQRKSISAADRVRGAGKDPEPPGDPAGDQQGQDGGQHKPAHAEQDAVSGLLPAHGIETGIIRYEFNFFSSNFSAGR